MVQDKKTLTKKKKKKSFSYRASIAQKFSIAITLLIIIIVINVIIGIQKNAQVIKDDFDDRIKQVTGILAKSLTEPLVGNDITFLEQFINDISLQQDVVYIMIIDNEKQVFFSIYRSVCK